MPATPPQFNRVQGGTSTTLNLVTTIRDQVFTGVIDTNTVDLQVSVDGAPFRADPTLVEFDQSTFTIPNRNVFPDGLSLNFGRNVIQVRAVDTTGAVSSPSTVTVDLLRETEVDLVSAPPTGIRLRRKRASVEVVFAQSDLQNVRGYNVYASTEPGGGTSGYFKLNRDLITDVAFQEETLTAVSENDTSTSGIRTVFLDSEFGEVGVTIDQRDFNDTVLSSNETQLVDASLGGARLKVTTTVESVTTTNFLLFEHNRSATEAQGTINNEFFVDIPDDEPLYYVITTVVYDPITNREIESAFSSELTGLPLAIDSQIREIPRRTRFDVSEDYIDSILSIDNEISVIPGSVVRDIFIDPFATEAERLYFVADFISRSQSFATLLVVDGSDSYKAALASALGINATTDVQPIIDDSFDKLAGNNQVTRQGAEIALGEVVFFTPNEPTQDIVIEAGTSVGTDSNVTFTVTATTTLPFADRASYFNLQRQRYEITVPVQADDAGSAGNVPANTIRNTLGGVGTLQVTNLEATQFGRDEESNEDLATRAILAFSSVDAGTEAGYLATALRQQGVFRALVVEAGDQYMARDYDEVRMKNIGGKVDVWVQGEKLVTVSDTFALQFDVERDVRFFLDSNPSDLIFVADDDRLSPEAPITQVLGETPSEIAQGFGFRNLTSGETFDLSGVAILDFNRIQLNTAIPQPAVNPNDLISGDYRFRESDQFVFTRQPVRSVNSVQSITSGDTLARGTNYDLFKLEDPLFEGESTQAQDFLQITQANGIPTGDVVIVNNESHVLIGQIPEALNNLGVSPLTVRVFNLGRTIEYAGPTAATPDFFINPGDETTPLELVRNPDGTITNGQEVVVDYEHDENFSVEYVINEVVQDVQNAVEAQRHVTADVLVKQAIENPVDLEITIVLAPGAVQAVVDAAVRTNVSQLLNSLGIGEPVHQSDILRVIENTPGVDYVVVPLARLTHADDNLIVREVLNNAFTFLEQTAVSKLYVLQDALNFSTSDGGGADNLHKGVFQDRLPLTLVSSYAGLGSRTNAALIVGNGGLIIDGYSDDTTLEAAGFDTEAEKTAQRLALTANRIFLSLENADSPENHEYEVTYASSGDTQTRSTITLTDVTYAELGDLTITFRAAGT